MQNNDKNTNKIPTFSYFKGRKIPTFSYFGPKIPTFLTSPTTFNPGITINKPSSIFNLLV